MLSASTLASRSLLLALAASRLSFNSTIKVLASADANTVGEPEAMAPSAGGAAARNS